MVDVKPPVYRILKDAIINLGETVTHRQIIDWINGKYNDVNERTIRAHIEMASVNMPGRVGMSYNRKPRSIIDERYDFLFSIGRGEVELYNPTKHGKWSLMETQNGKTVIAKDGVPLSGDSEESNSEFEKIKRVCTEEFPKSTRNFREVAIKTLLESPGFTADQATILENIDELTFGQGHGTAIEMIREYLDIKFNIVEINGSTYSLLLSPNTSSEQVNELLKICGQTIAKYHIKKMTEQDDE